MYTEFNSSPLDDSFKSENQKKTWIKATDILMALSDKVETKKYWYCYIFKKVLTIERVIQWMVFDRMWIYI